jgi:hypothetical protein
VKAKDHEFIIDTALDTISKLEEENKMLMKFASEQSHFNAWVLKYRNEKKL